MGVARYEMNEWLEQEEEPYDPDTLEESGYGPAVPISRWLVPLGLVAVAGLLVGIALGRGQTHLDPSTPEGAVQQYLLALTDERWEDALAILDPDVYGNCTAEDFMVDRGERILSARHIRTFHGPAQAQVEVSIRYGTDSPFGGSWESNYTYTLIQRDRFWYILQDAWPAQLWSCAGWR